MAPGPENIKSDNLDNTFKHQVQVKTVDPLKPGDMEQSPNHEEPYKPNLATDQDNPGKGPDNIPGAGNDKKQPAHPQHPDGPEPGEPVLGSDKGPWEGTD